MDDIGNVASFYRGQLEKLHNKKMAYSAFTSKKRNEISGMVREEVQKDIERIVDTDYLLQKLYMTKRPQRMEVFDEELLKELEMFNEKSTTASGVGASSGKSRHLSALSERSVDQDSAVQEEESDEMLKTMLHHLVTEANFLVEDNLNLLCEEVTDDERNLFKLDSILTVIGT